MRKILILFTLLTALPASAVELHLLGGVDFFAANQPTKSDFAAAQIGFGVRLHLASDDHQVSFHFDYRDRTDLVEPNDSRHDLHHLSLDFRHLLGGHLDLSLGRFAVDGGFWLITDGGRLTLHLGDLFAVSVYGGLRSYTGGHEDTWIHNGDTLPLAGVSLTVDHSAVHGALAVTYTEDVIELYRGSPGGVEQIARIRTNKPEIFVDGQLVVLPHPKVFLAGGLSIGSRYNLTYPTGMMSAGPVTVDPQILSSFMGYAVGEWRPVSRLRLSYAFDFNQIKIAVPVQPLDTTGMLQTAGGSFEDHTVKASARIWRSLRLEARYRLRFRENTDVIHRFEGALLGDDLVAHLGLFATVGGDLYSISRSTLKRDSIAYTGGLSFTLPWLDARAGVLYTDAIGTGVAFSTHAKQAMGAGPTTELFPLVLEAQRIAFLRLFLTSKYLFGGIDLELNLDASQVRSMVQIGGAL